MTGGVWVCGGAVATVGGVEFAIGISAGAVLICASAGAVSVACCVSTGVI